MCNCVQYCVCVCVCGPGYLVLLACGGLLILVCTIINISNEHNSIIVEMNEGMMSQAFDLLDERGNGGRTATKT